MKKTVWITSLAKDEPRVQKIMAQVKTYGMAPEGHFWADENEKMTWVGSRERMIEKDVVAWVILVSEEEIEKPSVMYGLSLLALTVQAVKGVKFPIFFLCDGKTISNPPTPFANALVVAESSAWTAKLVAKTAVAPKVVTGEYRFDILGDEKLGQWFEVGPVSDTWKGVMFGISDGEINFQATGPKGGLPNSSVLNYAQQGLKLNLGETEYTAWALKNDVDSDSSYYVRVVGSPGSILFSEYAGSEDAEVYVVKLS